MATVTAQYATAYGSYKKLAISAGETPLSEAEWIASLKGDKGDTGELPFWVGTQAQYDALSTIDPNTVYFITG